jgi:uncharacterized protein (TIGR02611 family)
MTPFFLKSLRQVKRVIIGVVGFTVLAIGLVMIVLPGPAFIVIPVALGILATEFVWAKKLIQKVRSKIPQKKKTKEEATLGLKPEVKEEK